MELTDRRVPFSLSRLIAEARRRARQRRFALVALVVAVVGTTLAGVVTLQSSGGPLTLEKAGKGPILAGTGDVCAGPSGVWFSSPIVTTALTPPVCQGGDIRLQGFDASQLQGVGHASALGSAFVKGVYRNGVLYVVAQRRPFRGHVGPVLADVPCRQPARGWPSTRMSHRVWHPLYANLKSNDVVAWWQFKLVRPRRTVLAVASTNPARTRHTLGPLLPQRVCVSRSHYSRHAVEATRSRLESASAWKRFRIWVESNEISLSGQPVLRAHTLRMTPQLRAWLRTMPAGLVRVIPDLRRVGRNSG
jgi:hypothetical protein